MNTESTEPNSKKDQEENSLPQDQGEGTQVNGSKVAKPTAKYVDLPGDEIVRQHE